MLNPFFLQGSANEQGLIQDLVNEHLRIFGVDVYYLPRQYVSEKTVIKEVIQSEFNFAFPLEAYVDTYEGYGNQGTILSKFGVQELDDLVLIISRERFENYISPIIKNIPNIKLTTRPKEGDVIYFPLGDRLFEIKYVEHEKPFYQLQKNYVYELRCELFRYEDEKINTGIEFIDDNVKEEGYIQTIQMVGIGSSATAIASSVNGGVRYINIINRGYGYKSTPKVAISSAPIGGASAIGIASMIGGIVDLCEGNPQTFRVQAVNLIQSGYGYTSPPSVSFIGGGGKGAEAEAIIADGVVGIITITNGGSGYTTPPNINFNNPSSGIKAKAIAIIKNGSVIQIQVTDGGSGYNQPSDFILPSITIDSPPSTNSGVGSYIFNENVVGSVSGVKAIVKYWNLESRILEVSNVTGNFISGEELIGETSGAKYTTYSINTDNLNDQLDDEYIQSIDEVEINHSDKYAQNFSIQQEANKILDFSERNPFGIP